MSIFDQLVAFGKEQPILMAFYASLFTWGLTASGAALVFFFKKMKINQLKTTIKYELSCPIKKNFVIKNINKNKI